MEVLQRSGRLVGKQIILFSSKTDLIGRLMVPKAKKFAIKRITAIPCERTHFQQMERKVKEYESNPSVFHRFSHVFLGFAIAWS